VVLYEQILAIQEKYYSSKDERRALTLNNIACAWSTLNHKAKARMYFEQALKIVTKGGEIESLVTQNFSYYFPGAKSIYVVNGMGKCSLK
jgi:hypothetical protein